MILGSCQTLDPKFGLLHRETGSAEQAQGLSRTLYYDSGSLQSQQDIKLLEEPLESPQNPLEILFVHAKTIESRGLPKPLQSGILAKNSP